MKFLSEKIILKQVKVYDSHAGFAEVYTEPAILLLSGGTDLNEIIRSFLIFTFIFECYFLFSVSQVEQKKKDKIDLKIRQEK